LCVLFGKSIDYLMNEGKSVTINAGSGIGFSFLDIVDEIESQTGQTISRENSDAKTGDVVKIICDITRAREVLGWAPQQTDLKEIINYALHNQ